MSTNHGRLEHVPLADGFASADFAAWRRLAEASLKGGDFDKRLVSKTLDGLALQPVYERQSSPGAVMRGEAGRPWRLTQRVDDPEPERAAAQAVADLEGGADSLAVVFPASAAARGFGVSCDRVDALDASLKGAALDMIQLRVEPAPAGRINAAMAAALVERRGHAPGDVNVSFGMDPIGTLTTLGTFSAEWDEVGRRLSESVTALRARGFTGPFVACDTRPFHEAGASEAQELALALAMGVQYLRALSENGLSLPESAQALEWTFAVDADQFLTIAKLRAMRRLWARVQEASGLEEVPIQIHCETAWRMLTATDPAVNMLRATIATFSAGIGGADGLSVLPHTSVHGLPDAHARRVARNTQVMLLEESNLFRVADPASGAGAFEALTAQLCTAAWSKFQDIEAAGGLYAALREGQVQRAVAEQRQARAAAVARGKLALTGTSAFPLLDEPDVTTLDVAADLKRGMPKLRAGKPAGAFGELIAQLKEGASRSDVMPGPQSTVMVAALPSVRIAEPFETLRARADAATKMAGKRPQVFIANLGPLADNTARTMWTRNLLATAGIEGVTASDGFTATPETGAAFAASGLDVAVIAGSDEAYSEMVDATAALLKTVGAKKVYIARKPGGGDDVRTTGVGIDGHFYAGQDMVAALGDLQEVLGV